MAGIRSSLGRVGRAAGARWQDMRRWRRLWLGGGAILALVAGLGELIPAAALAPAGPLFTVWAVLTGLALARALWRRLTYRIGVRLFLSYLVIGITPFLLTAALAFVTGYMLTGQYAAARFRATMLGEYDRLAQLVCRACEGSPAQAPAVLEEGARQAAKRGLALEWVLQDGSSGLASSTGAEAELPAWASEEPWAGPAVKDGRPVAAAVVKAGSLTAAVFVPLDVATARVLSSEEWYEARFVRSGAEQASFNITISEGRGGGRKALSADGTPVSPDEVEAGWLDTGMGAGGLWAGRWVVWFSTSQEIRAWREEAGTTRGRVVALLKVSPRGAFRDLFAGGPYQLADEAVTALGVIGLVLLVLYAVAVGLAAWMIVSIARSTSRLTRGAHQVGQGDLSYRIPVKRRDQLGDLALAFNGMADSVERMLADVREKERLTQELALAREIQQSLLPHTSVRHGVLAVTAHFRPAAEIGGDFFDVVRLDTGSLLIAVGDVAGHGLPTGLHMAMVKAALGALASEGRRGAQLVTRLNHLILAERSARRMVTLAVAEIDTGAGLARLTLAGHPPAFLLSGGEVKEVEAAALPLGFTWPDAPGCASVAFAPGDRLVLYSDGLVEARRPDGEWFGYERLERTLRGAASGDGEGVLAACLGALDGYLQGAAVPDDVTLVVAEYLAPSATTD